MTAEQIREMKVPEYEFGHPVSEVHDFGLQLAREFLAQLAELNMQLKVMTWMQDKGDPR